MKISQNDVTLFNQKNSIIYSKVVVALVVDVVVDIVDDVKGLRRRPGRPRWKVRLQSGHLSSRSSRTPDRPSEQLTLQDIHQNPHFHFIQQLTRFMELIFHSFLL